MGDQSTAHGNDAVSNPQVANPVSPSLQIGQAVRVRDTSTYATVVRTEVSESDYNPGVWALLRYADGFAAWSPICNVVPMATTCVRCGATYEYEPRHHKCPGQWEAECAAAGIGPVSDPYAGMSWVEQCMAMQNGL